MMNLWKAWIVASLVLIGFSIHAHAGSTCPAVTAPGGRGNIHTEVIDQNGHLRAITSVRTYRSGTSDANMVIGTDNSCPPQGCGVNFGGPRQDCTATNTSKPFFGWALSHGSTVILSTQSSMDIKQPSGTVIFSQGGFAGPRCHFSFPGTIAMNTFVTNSATGSAISVKSVRIVAGLHGGNGPLDYYAVIGVDTNSPAVLPASTGSDCTTASNPWYDLYWNIDGHQTVAESIVPYTEYPGVVQLNQGE